MHFPTRFITRAWTPACLLLSAASAIAQTPAAGTNGRDFTGDCRKLPNRTQQTDCRETHSRTYMVQLNNVGQQNDANEILVAVRNIADPAIKVFLVASTSKIVIRTTPEEFAEIETLIRQLDVPHKQFRVTISSPESPDSPARHISVVTEDGQRATARDGDRVPVATGHYDVDSHATENRQAYVDVGSTVDLTPNDMAGGTRLKLRIEFSSAAPGGGLSPTIRQTVFEGTLVAPHGKPLDVRTIDSSGRPLSLRVSVEPLN